MTTKEFKESFLLIKPNMAIGNGFPVHVLLLKSQTTLRKRDLGKRESEYRKEAFGPRDTQKEGVLRQSLIPLSFVAEPDIARDAFRNRGKIYIYL